MGFDFLDEARRIIGIISVSEQGTGDIARHLAGLIARTDLSVRLDEAAFRGVQQVNLIAEKGSESRDDLLLNTHLDTVPPGDPAAWTACKGDPFQASVDGDRIYGLGSADAKLDFLCKLKALEEFRGVPFRHRVALVGTHGEEVGLRGAQALVDGGFFHFAHALVGEPSSLRPIRAHKGLAVWEIRIDPAPGTAGTEERVEMMEIVFPGTAAHASTPALGRNAILAALDFLAEQIRRGRPPRVFGIHGGTASNVVPNRCSLLLARDESLAREAGAAGARIEHSGSGSGRAFGNLGLLQGTLAALRELEGRIAEFKEEGFDPPMTTMNLGRIETVEGVTRLGFEIRPVPSLPMEEVGEAVERLEEQLSNAFPDSILQIHNLRANPPMRDARDGVLLGTALEVLAELGLPAEAETKATCTEAAVYSQMGIDSIVFGPGLSVGNVHRANEHNLLSECEKAIAFYSKMIERLCL
jgi:acetylornithine deacetylase/succinyl-diaminopimelate desuccinylase-like protein